jgi:opacity protein-like surface antigen
MRRFFLLTIAVCCWITAATAQKGFNLGLDGAANLSFIINQNTYGHPEYNYAPTYHFAGGLSAGYNFDHHFGLQAELWTTHAGQNYAQDLADGATFKRAVDLYYTNIPLLFKYSGGAEYPTRFYLLFGPQLSYMRKATITIDSANTHSKITATDRFNKTDIELVLDLGSDFTIYHNLYASAGIRFNYGLDDINAPDWQIKNLHGMYNPSTTAWGGIHIGIHYVFGPPVATLKDELDKQKK